MFQKLQVSIIIYKKEILKSHYLSGNSSLTGLNQRLHTKFLKLSLNEACFKNLERFDSIVHLISD